MPVERVLAALDRWIATLRQSRFVADLRDGRPAFAVLRVADHTAAGAAAGGPNLGAVADALQARLIEADIGPVTPRREVLDDPALAALVVRLGDEVDDAVRRILVVRHEVRFAVSGRVGDRVVDSGSRRRVRAFLFLRVTDLETGRVVHEAQVDVD